MDEHADAAGISSKVVYTMFIAMRLLGNETTQIKKYVNLFRTILKKIYANVWMNW